MTTKPEKTLDQKILDDVLGDSQHIFTDPDTLHALSGDMPSWMTDNLLDPKPAAKAKPLTGDAEQEHAA